MKTQGLRPNCNRSNRN